MAVTRINNNQVSDASAGNAYLGINAGTKLQNYSITATKIANNLTYGSDLTVTGNLTVQGNTTTIDTTYTTIEDPILLLASNQTGSPTVDIGFVGQRGTSQNIAFVWDESAGQFITAYTTTGESNTVISIASYADLHVGNANIGGNIVVNGTTSFVGNLTGNLNVSGNIAGGNLLTNGLISSTGNVQGANFNTDGLVSAAGNITSAANIAGGNLLATTAISAASVLGSIVSASGNVTGGNINSSANISATANVTASYYFGNGSQLTGVSAATSGFPVTAGTSNIAAATDGNIGVTVAGTSNVVTFASTGEYVTGLISATGNIVSSANINAASAFVNAGAVLATGRVEAGTTMSAAGNITGANIITGGLITATGNITSAANVAGGNVLATTIVSGASVLGSIVSASGNVTGGNILTGGLISATGNITSAANVAGGNLVATTAVVTPTVIGTTVTVSSTGGLITLAPSSNVSVSSKNINNLAQPVQDQDAATKLYVDNMVSTQLAYHQAVVAATNTTLETATGGTITYAQPNGAGNGVGATLTVSGGTFNLIDTANIQTANTRVLVKDQANAVLNGIYIWSNATVLTRSTDADTYGPNSTTDLSINDYFFVQSGNVNAGSAWIVDAPSGTITFGTSNISFAQFSSSQTYTANTLAGISLAGTVINAKIDNNTTAFDGSGNIIVKAGANLTTPNIGAATGTSLSVTGNLTAAGANISGNISGGNLLSGGLASITGNITSAANISGGNLLTGGLISSTGNITSAANVAGGNLVATTIVSGASVLGTIVSASANVTGGNLLTGGLISSTGNITSAANVAGGNVIATTIVSGASLIGTIVSASANITGGNILTSGLISATGNITSASNVAGGNIISSANVATVGVSASGNITGGNILTGGLISSTGNITSAANISGGNLIATTIVSGASLIGTLASLSGNITGANLNTGGANGLTLNASTINSNASRIVVNSNSSAIDFAVNGTLANVFYVNGTTNTVSIGSSTQTTNAALAINATNSILFPVGNTAQRPGTGVTGMIRFNSTLNAVEVYDNSTWATVGTPTFTIIADEQFTGNGVQTAFTLSSSSYTTNSVIVSINGVVQIPTTAYSVSGATLTFTEAPQTGDLIDVRELVTTTQVTSISNSPGNAAIAVSPTTAVVSMTGNVIPVANATQTLGSSTAWWGNIYGTAVNAQYADLAEVYAADAKYDPGTVLSFGGDREVTLSTVVSDSRIAGVVSTNPSYVMNATLESEFTATVALTGRVPTKVSGPVAKGDMMVSGGNGRAVACATPAIGTVIGKALENHTGGDGIIEVVVGRL